MIYNMGNIGLDFLRGLLISIFMMVLIAVAVMDYEKQRIDNRFHVIIFVLGVVAVWLFPECGFVSKCTGALAVSVPMFVLTMIVPGAFGGGDIKLMAVSGWLLGAKLIIYAMGIALLSGGIYCAAMLACGKIGRKDSFAFGPWLAFGILAAVFMRGNS